MPRTRDLLLVGIAVTFLLLAIGSTVVSRLIASGTTLGGLSTTQPITESTATIPVTETLSRAERLAAMREKVAAEFESSSIAAPPIADGPAEDETMVAEGEAGTSTTDSTTDFAVNACENQVRYAGVWQPVNISFTVTEGVRLVMDGSNTATASGTPTTLLQLPLRTFPDAVPQCLSSDVIGVAQDGSLIRNDEAGLYGVFGADTVIGYALDGFPIYGVSDIATDTCGGAVVNGQYAYYLSTDRPTILGCFAAPPVALP